MKKTLIIGYGNRDREDDGAGWHMLNRIARELGLDTPNLPGDNVISSDGNIELLYLYQLLPELAEDLANYNVVIFMDAHNSSQLPEVVFEPVIAKSLHSAFTHHLLPEELLSISLTICKTVPECWIVSVRGHSFRFTPELTAKTDVSVTHAIQHVLRLLASDQERKPSNN